MQHEESLIWSFDIRHGAEAAGHAAVLLAAFALTIIILLIGSSGMRRDKLSSFIIRPFLLAFIGNLIAAFEFMMVQSDATLSERTFALMVPPDMMAVVSTMMMLFGINLALLRYFSDKEVSRFALGLYVIAGLYTVGVVHRGVSDVEHVRLGLHRTTLSVMTYVSALVLGPGVAVLGLEAVLSRMRVNMQRLHNWNLWWCTAAFVIGVVVFGLALLLEPEDHVPALAIPIMALVMAFTQWIVLGSSFFLLRRFPELASQFPLPDDDGHEHDHPPHPPV